MNNDERPRRTWSDEAKRTNRRRRLLGRITKRAPLLAISEYERAVLLKPEYFGEGTALPPPVTRRTASKRYRSRHEVRADKRRLLLQQIDAFRREHGWDAVAARLDFLRRRNMQQWAADFPAEAACAFPLFDSVRPDAG